MEFLYENSARYGGSREITLDKLGKVVKLVFGRSTKV